MRLLLVLRLVGGPGAAIFAVAWRWWGAWIIAPVVGAVLGASATIALALLILSGLDLRGAGLHGGGDIAAFLVIGLVVVSAVLGAIAGGVLFGVAALIVGLATRRRRRAPTDNPPPPGK